MKRLSILALVGLALLVLPATATATDPDNWSTCNGGSYLILAEDTGGGGATNTLCVSHTVGSVVNLRDLTHYPAGYCHGKFISGADNWNDCVSSVYARFSWPDNTLLTNEYCFIAYTDYDAGGSHITWDTTGTFQRSFYSWNNVWRNVVNANDQMSSIRYGRLNSNNNCTFS